MKTYWLLNTYYYNYLVNQIDNSTSSRWNEGICREDRDDSGFSNTINNRERKFDRTLRNGCQLELEMHRQ